jgi:hypothetical protein
MVKALAFLLSAVVVVSSSTEEVDHTGLLQTTKHRSSSRSVASRTHNDWETGDVECDLLNLCCKSSLNRLELEGQREIENVEACASRIEAEITAEQQAIAAAEASKENELQQTAEALSATTAAQARAGEIEQTIEDARANHRAKSDELGAEYQKLENDFNAVRQTALKVAAFIHAPDLCDVDGQPYGYGTNLLQAKRFWGSWQPFKEIVRSVGSFLDDAGEAISNAVDDVVDWTCDEVIHKHTDKVCHSRVVEQQDQYEKDLAAAQATVTQLKSALETKKNALTASLALQESARRDKLKQISAQTEALDLVKQLTDNLKTLRENNAKAIAALQSDIKLMEDVVSAFKTTFSENLFKEMRSLGGN